MSHLAILPRLAPSQCDPFVPDDAERFRRVLCAHARECCHIADEARWPAFHCNNCGAYREIDAVQKMADLGRIADMIEAAPRYEQPIGNGKDVALDRGTKMLLRRVRLVIRCPNHRGEDVEATVAVGTRLYCPPCAAVLGVSA